MTNKYGRKVQQGVEDFVFDFSVDYKSRFQMLWQMARAPSAQLLDTEELDAFFAAFIRDLSTKFRTLDTPQRTSILRENLESFVACCIRGPLAYQQYLQNIELFDTGIIYCSGRFGLNAPVLNSLDGVTLRLGQSDSAQSRIIEATMDYIGRAKTDPSEIHRIAKSISAHDVQMKVKMAAKREQVQISNIAHQYLFLCEVFGREATIESAEIFKFYHDQAAGDLLAFTDLLLYIVRRGADSIRNNTWIFRNPERLVDAIEMIALEEVESYTIPTNGIESKPELNVLSSIAVIMGNEKMLPYLKLGSAITQLISAFDNHIDRLRRKGICVTYPMDLSRLKSIMPSEMVEMMIILKAIHG